jgi:hypothetical protein
MESSKNCEKKIGNALAKTSKRHGDTFAETHQGDEKEYRADGGNSHKVRPYRAEAGATIENRLGETDEVGGGRRLHNNLHDLWHALVGCAAAGEHLQGQNDQNHHQAQLGHRARKGAKKDPHGGAGKQMQRSTDQKQRYRAGDGHLQQPLHNQHQRQRGA